MLLYILAGIGALFALILIIAATKPSAFRIERSATFNAPPDRVFPLLDDFHSWQSWSPWEGKDPNLKRMFSGPERGVGSRYAWVGNNQVGEGKMEITQSVPSSKVVFDLDFIKPFQAHNTGDFTLTQAGSGTRVVWGMSGNHAYMMKVMSMFMPMEKMIGKDFDTGLANLKAAAEK